MKSDQARALLRLMLTDLESSQGHEANGPDPLNDSKLRAVLSMMLAALDSRQSIVASAYVEHEADCPVFRGKPCRCDAIVSATLNGQGWGLIRDGLIQVWPCRTGPGSIIRRL